MVRTGILAVVMAVMLPAASFAQGSSANFSEAKLEAYAKAVPPVMKAYRGWKEKMQTARGDPDLVDQVRTSARQDIETVIEQQDGITPAEYTRISIAARNDPDLYDRLDAMVGKVRSGQTLD